MTKSQTKTQSLTSIIQKIAKGLNKFTIDDVLQLGDFEKKEVIENLVILENKSIIKKLSETEYLYSKMKPIERTEAFQKLKHLSPEWLTMEEVQELTKEKLETIRRKCKSGKYLSHYKKVGKYKKYVIHKSSITKAVKDKCSVRLNQINFSTDIKFPVEEQKLFKKEEEQKIYDNAPEYAKKFCIRYLTIMKMVEQLKCHNIQASLKQIGEQYPEYKTGYPTYMARRRKFLKFGINGLMPGYGKSNKVFNEFEQKAYECFKKIYLSPNAPTINQTFKMLTKYGFDKDLLPSEKSFKRYLEKEYTKDEIMKMRLPIIKFPAIKTSLKEEPQNKNKIYCETFMQGAEAFLKENKNKKNDSSISQRGFLANHLIPYFKNFRFDEITQDDILKFQSKMLAEGFSSASLNMIISVLSKICRTYAKIDSSLSFSIKNNIFEPLETGYLPDKEISRIKKNNCPELWIICLGINIGELLALRYEDINFKNKIVTIDKISYKNAVQSHRRQYRIRNLKLPDCIFKLLDKNTSGIIFNEINIENYDILLNTHIHLMLEKNIQINLISKNLGYQCLNDFEARFNFLLPQRLDENFEII